MFSDVNLIPGARLPPVLVAPISTTFDLTHDEQQRRRLDTLRLVTSYFHLPILSRSRYRKMHLTPLS